MPGFDDPDFLKSYLQSHPNQKMAWYLLGREYAAKGEAAKAAYCYVQAGEVYEAFEKKPLPPEVVAAGRAEASRRSPVRAAAATTADGKRRSRRARWFALAALGLAVALAYAPGYGGIGSPASQQGGDGRQGAADESNGAPTDERYYWLDPDPGRSAAAIGGMLGTWLQQPPEGSRRATFLELAAAEGDWLRWDEPLRPVLTLSGGAGMPNWTTAWHDAARCDCEPAEGAPSQRDVAAWQDRLEQEAILTAAVRHHAERNGSLPAAPEELAKRYPGNSLSGITPAMAEMFPDVVAKLREAGQPSPPPGERQGDGPASRPASSQGAGQSLDEPLQIVVDRSSYTLALVSGPIILRSYPVGLGGELTPEGTYPITEKVKNPNGSDKGAFGSRGMTLGDTLYAIHGTNEPDSIGKDESLGCVRMAKDDIEELFAMVPLGTPVTIGAGLLPKDDPVSRKPGYAVPSQVYEENPGKVYKWL